MTGTEMTNRVKRNIISFSSIHIEKYGNISCNTMIENSRINADRSMFLSRILLRLSCVRIVL